MTSSTPARRRRRTPEVARNEILDAAEGILRELPFRELSIDAVMAKAGLSKASFWVYFRDRNDLVAQVLARLDLELGEMADRWFQGDGDPDADLRFALAGVVAVFVAHGRVLRAIADAATQDAELDARYGEFVERFVVSATRRIRAEQRGGRIPDLDAAQTARALVWMNERYLSDAYGRGPAPKPQAAIDTLAEIWAGALYRSR